MPCTEGATAAIAATALARRRARRWKKSTAQMAPVSTSSENRMRAKSQLMARTPYFCSRLLILDLQNRQKGLLGNFNVTHLFHPLLARLLALKQLFLAGNIATITLGQDVLAQGLDVFTGNHVRTDGRL